MKIFWSCLLVWITFLHSNRSSPIIQRKNTVFNHSWSQFSQEVHIDLISSPDIHINQFSHWYPRRLSDPDRLSEDLPILPFWSNLQSFECCVGCINFKVLWIFKALSLHSVPFDCSKRILYHWFSTEKRILADG